MTEFGDSQSPLIRRLENGKYELHSFFKDFLREKLLALDGAETKQRFHAEFAERYEALGELREAIHHALQIQDWPKVIRLLTEENEHLLAESPLFVKTILESFPPEQFLADPRLVNLRGNALIQLGDMAGAYRGYREVLAQKARRARGRRRRGLPPNGGELGAAKRIWPGDQSTAQRAQFDRPGKRRLGWFSRQRSKNELADCRAARCQKRRRRARVA